MHVPGGMALANVLRRSSGANCPRRADTARIRPKECIGVGVSSQMLLDCLKFSTADIAELEQGIVVHVRAQLNLFESKVRFRIRTDDVLNHLFSAP